MRIGETTRLTPWLVLVLMSLQVVNDQFRYLVLMQTNREDLGKRIREIVLPIPAKRASCASAAPASAAAKSPPSDGDASTQIPTRSTP